MEKEKEDTYTTTEYELLGMRFDKKPTDAEVGVLWILAIISFPAWIWLWIGYKILETIGKELNRVKKVKVTKKKDPLDYY